MELPTVPANATANGALQLPVAPGADSRLRMISDVAGPQRAKWPPANRRTATAIGAVADGAAHCVQIVATLQHAHAFGGDAARIRLDIAGVHSLHEWIRRHIPDSWPLGQNEQ